MTIEQQIQHYIDSQPEQKRSDMHALHHLILGINPNTKLWFIDGKNSENKVVSNPSVGYGTRTTHYADGKTREYYQIGISANSTGISVYILGYDDKHYLSNTYGKTIGKAAVTGYCIKFKSLKDINTSVLCDAIRDGFKNV